MDPVTPKAGRWRSRLGPSRLLGDARRQSTPPQLGRAGRWPPGRRLLGLGLVVVVLGGLWGIAAGVVVHPATETAHPADALAVFAGGRGERLSTALGLLQQQVAAVLVISNGRDVRWQAANQLCASRQRFEMLCPQPDPDTTRGEARMVRDLAAQRGWRSAPSRLLGDVAACLACSGQRTTVKNDAFCSRRSLMVRPHGAGRQVRRRT